MTVRIDTEIEGYSIFPASVMNILQSFLADGKELALVIGRAG